MKSFAVKSCVIGILLTCTVGILSTGPVFAWGIHKDMYSEEEEESQYTEIAAQHILVKTAAEAMQIKKDLDNGGSFEYYAKKYSICPSGKSGGFLGYFGKGQMVPEFEKKAFSMNVGEISNPIRTDFGWHIIKIVDKR